MSKVLQNAPREHSAILLTFIKLQFVFKLIFILSIFEWPLKTSFTVEAMTIINTYPMRLEIPVQAVFEQVSNPGGLYLLSQITLMMAELS